MLSPRNFPLLAVLALAYSLSPARSADPVLSVQFLAEGRESSSRQEGFEPFPVPGDLEAKKMPPFSRAFGPYTVTIGYGGKQFSSTFPDLEGRVVTRLRAELEREQRQFPYIRLYQNWVAYMTTIALRVTGLKPSQTYQARFFAIDVSERDRPREGGVTIHNLTDGQGNEVLITWDSSPLDADTPVDRNSGLVECTTTADGTLEFAVTSTSSETPILNGFQIEETP